MRTDAFLVAAALCSAAIAAPAVAQTSAVALDSEVLVERTTTDAQGRTVVRREAPIAVVPGDRLVFRIAYRNTGDRPATNFVLTNPLPASIRYACGAGAQAQLSIDGGATWGTLASLKRREADGSERPANEADVTHVRWTFPQPIPAGARGELSFSGTVR